MAIIRIGWDGVGAVDGELVADEIFYALGRTPNVEGVGLEAAGIAPAQKTSYFEFAGLSPERVPLLDFTDQLKLVEGRV